MVCWNKSSSKHCFEPDNNTYHSHKKSHFLMTVQKKFSAFLLVLFFFLLLLEATPVVSFALVGYRNDPVILSFSSSISTIYITKTSEKAIFCRSLYLKRDDRHRLKVEKNDDKFDIADEADTTMTAIFKQNSRPQIQKRASKTSASANTESSELNEWEVYVDQSKLSLDKGGSATLDAFVGLAPSSVMVRPAILVMAKNKAKGPLVRCIKTGRTTKDETQCSFDVANVDSVDKVYRVLARHMQVKGVSTTACDCLKWKFKGNGHLESGNIALAVDAYNNALATGWSREKGIVLLMRATAYLKRASLHKQKLKEVVNDLILMVPRTGTLTKLFKESSHDLSLSNSVFRRVITDTRNQEKQFRRTQYWHGLYQYALLYAAQDSLRATQLLPNDATAWVRAGNILSELWKLKESAQYYEYAIGLDDSLADSLLPVIDRLGKRQELLDSARAYGWSEDTLRLALDVTG